MFPYSQHIRLKEFKRLLIGGLTWIELVQMPFSYYLIVLDTYIWYSQRVRSSSHTLLKEKVMPEPRTCHLPNITALFCIVVSDMIERGGRR